MFRQSDDAIFITHNNKTDRGEHNNEKSGRKRKVVFTEKRVVTFNPTLAKKQLYEINKLIEKAQNLLKM